MMTPHSKSPLPKWECICWFLGSCGGRSQSPVIVVPLREPVGGDLVRVEGRVLHTWGELA